jgi:hypothetical protein
MKRWISLASHFFAGATSFVALSVAPMAPSLWRAHGKAALKAMPHPF